MLSILDGLRELTIESVALRLTLAMALGGVIGLEREQKRRPAGFRTYMLVCLGSALTMVLGQYLYVMLESRWVVEVAGARTDMARIGAQVINGIGFLGAGTVIVTSRQEVKGLTTAAGLWASACMGLAVGAGFYECVLLGFLLILLCTRFLTKLEYRMVETGRYMNLYVELNSLENAGAVINCLKQQNIHIYEVDLDRGTAGSSGKPNAVLALRLNQKMRHTQVVSAVSALDCVTTIEEI